MFTNHMFKSIQVPGSGSLQKKENCWYFKKYISSKGIHDDAVLLISAPCFSYRIRIICNPMQGLHEQDLSARVGKTPVL